MIFQKIAEWLTGRKRTDDKHPLDYINNKYSGEAVSVPKPSPTVEIPPMPSTPGPEVFSQPPIEQKPEPVKCGCGRSPTGFCVGLHKLTEAEWSVHADNPKKAEPVTEAKRPRRAAKPKAEAEKKPQAKKTADKKPAAKKEPAKTKKAAAPVKPRTTKKAKST